MTEEEYLQKIFYIITQLPERDRQPFINALFSRTKSPLITFGLSAFLGSFGIDRFYLGHIGLGICKLLTCGGFGIWTIIDWFLVAKAARRFNLQQAQNMTGIFF